MKFMMKIGYFDLSTYIESGGVGWERNDIDSAKTGRMLNGDMFRKRIAKKRKLSITLLRITTVELREICAAIDPEFIQVTFLDPALGVITKTFYGSSISATTFMTMDGVTYWDGANFNLVEK